MLCFNSISPPGHGSPFPIVKHLIPSSRRSYGSGVKSRSKTRSLYFWLSAIFYGDLFYILIMSVMSLTRVFLFGVDIPACSAVQEAPPMGLTAKPFRTTQSESTPVPSTTLLFCFVQAVSFFREHKRHHYNSTVDTRLENEREREGTFYHL